METSIWQLLQKISPEIRVNKGIILLLRWERNNHIEVCKLLLQFLNSVVNRPH